MILKLLGVSKCQSDLALTAKITRLLLLLLLLRLMREDDWTITEHLDTCYSASLTEELNKSVHFTTQSFSSQNKTHNTPASSYFTFNVLIWMTCNDGSHVVCFISFNVNIIWAFCKTHRSQLSFIFFLLTKTTRNKWFVLYVIIADN